MGRESFALRLTDPDVYWYPDIDWETISDDLAENVTVTDTRKIKYYEVPISFDIETTSCQSTEIDKAAYMYVWVVSINGHVILGREWWEFHDVYDKIVELFEPDSEHHVIIWVHNLAYEFQFICHRFEWTKVFSLRERKPITAKTTENVEFRCSYMLSGLSLEKTAENLQRYKIKKLVGDLDYSLYRHHKTPLTDKEIGYVINDAQVVVAYIQETAENDGGYHKIPLTKTGYVRNYCREECFKDPYYRRMISNMTVDADEYAMLKRAFAGGFTHANWHWSKRTLDDMDSFDFTSSYPSVMVAEKYPMSKSKPVEPESDEEFRVYLDRYCCLFDIEIYHVNGWDSPDHILSISKCRNVVNPIVNNGRIITADSLRTTMTEVDFECFEAFYKHKGYKIANMRIYTKSYLPRAFVMSILKLYKDKTELKDVDGKEVEYMKSKGMVNSAYGMCVTDIIRDEAIFADDWDTEKPDPEKALKKYNNSKKRFLFYPWGVWVTAHARRNLYTGILEFGEDYVYSDTDSIKAKNADAHRVYLERYNEEVTEKLKEACKYHQIPFELTRPKTIEGVEKPLGVWDYDGHYRRFKTLGAKRYMTEKLNKKGEWEINITVAGLNKKSAVPYIRELAEKRNVSMFDVFDEDLEVPGEHTGKQLHTYQDNETSIVMIDYTGIQAVCHELSSIHLGPASYNLTMNSEYIELINGIKYVKE